MTINMGGWDRGVRILVGLVLGWLYLGGLLRGALGIVLLVIAVLMLVTGLTGICPGYLPFKFSTRKTAPASPGAPTPPQA
jgi:hypothetical protein